jgi:hypothetical protein
MESFRKESFRRNHSETAISGNWNLSEWNLAKGIFRKTFSAKPESFRKNLSETNLSERIFQKESCRNDFKTQ